MGASRVFKKRGGVECKKLQGEASWCPISHQVQKLLKYRSNLYHCIVSIAQVKNLKLHWLLIILSPGQP